MTINAFPSGHNPKTGMYEHGMTLRDYFAAKAMQEMIPIIMRDYHDNPEKALTYDNYLLIAVCAYEISDSMLDRRRD